ncbi:MAG: response regulator transcription factor [Vulcanimicrobiota bacterium]
MSEGQKVLVVDDEPHILRSLATYLEMENFDVTTASSGFEALEKVDESIPDLVVLDVMMPGMDGFEVLDKIRAGAQTADIPVIMLTAKDQSEDVMTGYQKGATSYLVKPFNLDELVDTIHQVFAMGKK